MTQGDAKTLDNGVYVLVWEDGLRSLTAVGRDDHGGVWYAPVNWISGRSFDWEPVEKALLICADPYQSVIVFDASMGMNPNDKNVVR